jgi:hypothetical protein
VPPCAGRAPVRGGSRRRPPGSHRPRGSRSARRSARRWPRAAGRGARARGSRRRSRRSIPSWCARSSPRRAGVAGSRPASRRASMRAAKRSTARVRPGMSTVMSRSRSQASGRSALSDRIAPSTSASAPAMGGCRHRRAGSRSGCDIGAGAQAGLHPRRVDHGVQPFRTPPGREGRPGPARAVCGPVYRSSSARNRRGRQTWRRSAALRGVGRGQAGDGGQKDAHVPRHRAQAEARQRPGKQREDLRVGLRRVAGIEELEAQLQVFRRAARAHGLLAEDLAQIGVARGFRPVLGMHLHHRHGEVRAQHHLAPVGIMGGVGAGADVLAVEVEERVGAQHQGRVDGHRTRRREHRLKRLGLGADVGFGGHLCRSRSALTPATRRRGPPRSGRAGISIPPASRPRPVSRRGSGP